MQFELRSLLGELLDKDTVASIQSDTMLFETGLLDSLKLVQLIAAIEERFSVVIPAEELLPENFEALSALGRYLQEKVKQKDDA